MKVLRNRTTDFEALASAAKPLGKEEMKSYVGGMGVGLMDLNNGPDTNCSDMRFCWNNDGGGSYQMNEVTVIGHRTDPFAKPGINHFLDNITNHVNTNFTSMAGLSPDNGFGGGGENRLGSATNPYTESQFNSMIENGTWKGGYVDIFGTYVGKETVINGQFLNKNSTDWEKATTVSLDAVSSYTSVKENLFNLASKSGEIGETATKYLKFTKTLGRGCGIVGVGLSAINLYNNHSTKNWIKLVFSIGALSLGPVGTATYSILEITGATDKVAEILSTEIDKALAN